MSSIDARLDILVNVADRGLDSLKRPQVALKQLLNAQAALDQQRQRSRDALASLNRLETEFASRIANRGRRELELLRIQRQQVAVEQERIARTRQALQQSAELAASRGNLALAEQRLNAALRLSNRGSAEAARIKQRLIRLDEERAARAASAARSIANEALAEARLARARGDGARELRILNAASRNATLNDEQRRRVLIALAEAERRAAREAERHRKEMEAQRRANNLLRSTVGALTRSFNLMTRALAAVVLIGFTLRTVFRSFGRFIVSPVVALTRNALEATEQFRRLEASLTGVVGSLTAARDLTRDVLQASTGLPVTGLEALSATRGLAFIPATAGTIATPGPQRPEEIQRLLRVLTGLSTIDPDQGVEGARFAVREALAGEFRSLRFRFELQPDVIAATIGKTLEDLKADPALTLQALERFVEVFVGDEAFNQFEQLLGVQAEKFRGALQEFFRLIGDQGVYDRARDLLRGAAERLNAGVRGDVPELLATARLISETLERLFDTLLDAGGRVLSRLTGQELSLLDNFGNLDLDAVGRSFANFVGSLTVIIEGLAEAAPRLATVARTLADALGINLGPITLVGAGNALGIARRSRENLINEQLLLGLRADVPGALIPGPGEIQLTIGEVLSGRSGERQRLEQIREFLPELEDEIAALERRYVLLGGDLEAFGGALKGPDPLDAARAAIRKATEQGNEPAKALTLRAQEFSRAIDQLGEFDSVVLPSEQIDTLANTIREAFDPTRPTSVIAKIGAADADIRDLTDRIASIQEDPALPAEELAEAVQGLFSVLNRALLARATLLNNVEDKTLQGIRTQVQQAPKRIDELPTQLRIQSASDILNAVLGAGGRPAISVPGVTGTGTTGRAFSSAISTAQASGIDTTALLNPSLIKSVADLIDALGENIQETSGDLEAATTTVIEATDAFRAYADQQAALADSDAQREAFQQLGGFLDDVRAKWVALLETADARELEEIAKRNAQTAAEALEAEGEAITRQLDALSDAQERVNQTLSRQQTGAFEPFGRIPGGGLSTGFFGAQNAFDQGVSRLATPGDPRSLAAQLEGVNALRERIASDLDIAQADLARALVDTSIDDPAQFRARVDRLTDRVEALDEALADVLEQRDSVFDTAVTNVQSAFDSLISGAPGSIAALPRGQTQISAIESTLARITNVGRLNQRLQAGGFAGGEIILRPEAVAPVVETLQLYANALEDAGASGVVARERIQGLGQEFQDFFLNAAETGPPELAEAYLAAAEAIRQFVEEAEQGISDVARLNREAAESISDGYRSAFGDVAVAVVRGSSEEIVDIVENLVDTVIRSITELVAELTIIRGVINPLLNSAFSLTGDNALATNSRFGNVFSGAEVVPFRQGGVFMNPGASTLYGGRIATIAEDRPEVVAPLARTRDGNVGITIAEGGRGGQTVVMNYNISTPNADSFRKSEGQIVRQASRRARRRNR